MAHVWHEFGWKRKCKIRFTISNFQFNQTNDRMNGNKKKKKNGCIEKVSQMKRKMLIRFKRVVEILHTFYGKWFVCDRQWIWFKPPKAIAICLSTPNEKTIH